MSLGLSPILSLFHLPAPLWYMQTAVAAGETDLNFKISNIAGFEARAVLCGSIRLFCVYTIFDTDPCFNTLSHGSQTLQQPTFSQLEHSGTPALPP